MLGIVTFSCLENVLWQVEPIAYCRWVGLCFFVSFVWVASASYFYNFFWEAFDHELAICALALNQIVCVMRQAYT